MPPTLDIFRDDPGFHVLSLSEQLSLRDWQPDIIARMGIFRVMPLDTQRAEIDRMRSVVRLLPHTPRGVPLPMHTSPQYERAVVETLRIGEEGTVHVAEVADRMGFGADMARMSLQNLVMSRGDEMRSNINATIEHLRLGAMRGILLDSDATTVLLNLYTRFGITPPSDIDFDLDNGSPANGAVLQKCTDVLRVMQDNLDTRMPIDIGAFVDSTFMDALRNHPEVSTAYQRWNEGVRLFQRREIGYEGFQFGGITWYEYRAAIPQITAPGTPVEFMPAGTGFCFPMGRRDLFVDYRSPIDHRDVVNTMALPLYFYTFPDLRGEVENLHAESRPLPILTRPEVSIPVTLT